MTSAAVRGKVLMACYHFPPDAGVGALRPARFARALPRFGWQPYVLTVRDEYRAQLDCDRLAGLENVEIVRTRELPSGRALYLWMTGRLKGRAAQKPSAGASSAPQPNRDDREKLRDKIRRYAISLMILLPDDEKGWALYSAFKAVYLIRTQKIDCLLTSGPPASVHFIGIIAKALTNARWIADFRDPWIESLEGRPPRARSRASDAIEHRMERAVVVRADRVITTTERLKDVLQRRYPDVPGDKMRCVPNGIDRDMFPVGREEKYSAYTITYAGTLYEGRTPEPLFRAVGELIHQGKIERAAIRIKLLGNCESIDGMDTRAMAKQYGLETVVEVLGFVPQSEAVRIMKKSHLLLVLAPGHHRLIVPAKLYDYLASGSKILALAEPGAAADFVRDTNSGRCLLPSDIDGLQSYLDALISTHSASEGNDNARWLERYDSTYLTGQLAAVMSALCPAEIAIGTRQ